MAEIFKACAELSIAVIVIIFLGLIGYAIAKKNPLSLRVTIIILIIISLIVTLYFFAVYNDPTIKANPITSNMPTEWI